MHKLSPKSFFFLLAAMAVCVQISWFEGSFKRPWYYNFDLDEYVNTDNLIMGQGHFPDHLVPPGLGMHAAFSVSTRLATALGALSVGKLDDVTQASFPLYAVAEHVRFLRAHSPWLVAITAAAFVLALSSLAPLPPLAGLALAALIFFLPSWSYQASIIRPEMFSLSFYGLALFFLATAARKTLPGPRLRLSLVAGVFVGLTLLTKIQSLFFVAMAYVLAVMWHSFFQDDDNREQGASPRLLVALSALQALAWGVLAVLAWRTPIYETATTLTNLRGLTKPGLVILALSAGTLAWAVVAALKPRLFERKGIRELLGPTSLTACVGLTTGLPLALLASLAAFPEPDKALRFTLSTLSTVFFQQSQFYYLFIFNWTEKFAANGFCLATVTLCAGATLWACRKGRVNQTPAAQFCLLVLTLLFYAVVFLGTRTMQGEVIVKDFVWSETAAALVIGCCLAMLFGRGHTPFSRRLGTALALTSLVVSLMGAYAMPKRQLAELSWYGYRGRPFTESIFEGNGLLYQALVQDRLKKADLTDCLAASSAGRTKVGLWRMVLPKAHVDSRAICPALPGLAPLRDCPGLTLTEIPASLQGASLFDAASKLMGICAPPPGSPVWARRFGLRLFVALPETELAPEGLTQTGESLILADASTRRRYHLYDASALSSLPNVELTQALYILPSSSVSQPRQSGAIINFSGILSIPQSLAPKQMTTPGT